MSGSYIFENHSSIVIFEGVNGFIFASISRLRVSAASCVGAGNFASAAGGVDDAACGVEIAAKPVAGNFWCERGDLKPENRKFSLTFS